MTKYVALLLGINVGKRRMKMVDLKQVFDDIGYSKVKTLLASGNVVFESDVSDRTKITEKLEDAIEKKFGFVIKIILRTQTDLQTIVTSDPFKNIQVDKNTRLYVLFLSEKYQGSVKEEELSDSHFKVLKIDDFEVYSVLQLTENSRTVDSMKSLGKEFGKATTMRNWNTVLKLASL